LSEDRSNGYEAFAEKFIAVRSNSGQNLVKKWANNFSSKATIIDIGAGYGEPLTSILINRGFAVSAIDASPKMISALRARFSNIDLACEAVEESNFFGRTFDGALAIGLIFLLSPEAQEEFVHRVFDALKSGGRFLFSAPSQQASWDDILTGRQSVSLGETTYCRILREAGFESVETHVDDDENHYFEALKT